MTNFFTSDLHLNHVNTLEPTWTNRPFRHTTAMNIQLVANWNKVVSHSDRVWFLGDFAINMTKQALRDIFRSLNGDKILIIGNHDLEHQSIMMLGWKEVHAEHVFKGARHTYQLSHYRPQPVAGDDRLYLHGHVHSRMKQDMPVYDVGVDANGLTPVSEQHLDRLAANFLRKRDAFKSLVAGK